MIVLLHGIEVPITAIFSVTFDKKLHSYGAEAASFKKHAS